MIAIILFFGAIMSYLYRARKLDASKEEDVMKISKLKNKLRTSIFIAVMLHFVGSFLGLMVNF